MELAKKHIRYGLVYFCIVAILGVGLRLFAVSDFEFNYRHVVHAHSHIALLGWVYIALTSLLYHFYLKKSDIASRYRILFWCTQGTLVGMLFTFPFTGYALLSILFSTLFLFASYYFAYLFFRYTPAALKETHSYKLIRAALWFMIISSIGPWALGGIMATVGSSSPWYRNAIYFYLHFQYNGWFIVALCGLFLKLWEDENILLSTRTFIRFYWLLIAGVLLTFFLSILWMQPPFLFYVLAFIGGALQVGAFTILLGKTLWHRTLLQKRWSLQVRRLLIIAGLCLGVKLIAQLSGSLPFTAQIIATNIDYVISYLHWLFLGLVSLALFALLRHTTLMVLPSHALTLYIIGFLLTEILIFYRGSVSLFTLPSLPLQNVLLSLASGILCIAIVWIAIANWKYSVKR